MLKKIALTMAITACSVLSPSMLAEEKSALTLIPGDYKGLLRVNVKKLFANKLIADKATAFINEKVPASDLSALAIDPVKDISNIYIGFTAPEGKQAEPKATVVIDTTRDINLGKLFDFAETKNQVVVRTKIKGYKAFAIISSGDKQVPYFIKIAPKRIVISTKESLKKSIKLLNEGGRNITHNLDVMALCDKGQKKEMFWIIGSIPKQPSQPGAPAVPEKGIFSVDVKDNVLDLGIELLFASKEDAAQTGAQLSMLTMMVPGMTQNAIAATDIKLATDKNKITIKLSLTEDKMKKIEQLVYKQMGIKRAAPVAKPKKVDGGY